MGESIFTRIQRWFRLKPPTLRRVLIANIAIYLSWVLVLGHIPVTAAFFRDVLALNPQLPDILTMPWQLFTYAFLHLGFGLGGLLHITFNMLWLVWLGQDYEELYGSERMAWLYGLGAVGGGLATVLLHAAFPGIPAFGGFVHGASGAVLAVIAAVATLNPDKRIGLLFLGIWPLKWILVAFLALDLLFGLSGNVSVSAHLGGALTGFLFARFTSGAGFGHHRSRRQESRPGASEPSSGILQKIDDWLGSRPDRSGGRTARSEQISDATIVAETEETEIDRILDKINEHGYESLTEKEKRRLYEASRD
jgi:membrane associated rhomboid family serine protease